MKNFLKPKQSALSIGSIMIDIITVIADDDVELMTLHNMTSSFLMLEQGRKVESLSIDTFVGGGGANTAVAMNRLGMDMDILALVGKDLNAEKAMNRLRQENIGLDHLKVCENVGSGVAVHIASHDRNAAIFTHRGANCHLSQEDVRAIDFTKYDLVYVTNLSNESADHFPQIVRQAAKANCFIASNPGIRQLTRLCEDFLLSLNDITLVSINTAEAETLIAKLVAEDRKACTSPLALSEKAPPLLKSGFKIGGFNLGLVEFMKNLADHGPDYVVITDGSKGAYLLHSGILYYCPPQDVVMKGSAGAGDSFSSTLASLIAAGNSPDIALCAASLNAAAVISCVDTQEGLLTFEALQQKLDQTPDTFDISTTVTRWTVT
ncbi:MAG: carbohydrate kinase family protein [Alphaproteobacteria bacterium]|nr:MAG: carbohydrate kinase family protein [Alphaproteobacteria bacterium]